MVCNFIKKEILALVYSCELCEISKNTFSTEHLWMTAFEVINLLIFWILVKIWWMEVLCAVY